MPPRVFTGDLDAVFRQTVVRGRSDTLITRPNGTDTPESVKRRSDACLFHSSSTAASV